MIILKRFFQIQLDKSEFHKSETAYLGHITSKNGVKLHHDKISVIKNTLSLNLPNK